MKFSHLLFLGLALANPAFGKNLREEQVHQEQTDPSNVRELNRHHHHHHAHHHVRTVHDSRTNEASKGTLRAPVHGKNACTQLSPCVADAIIVGGGAAGVSAAAYLKKNHGQDVVVLEALQKQSWDPFDDYGTGSGYGRARGGLKTLFGLSQNIDIGGEWVHTKDKTTVGGTVGWESPSRLLQSCLQGIHRHPTKSFTDKLKDEYQGDATRQGIDDHRWHQYSWWDFIHENIVEENNLSPNIMRGHVVEEIYEYDVDTNRLMVFGNANGSEFYYHAEVVIVTTSIQILKNSNPTLPTSGTKIKFYDLPETFWTQGVNEYVMGDGIKAWMKFNGNIYDTPLLQAKNDNRPGDIGDGSMFFDEHHGHDTLGYDDNGTPLVGFFAHGEMARDYVRMQDSALINDLKTKLGTYSDNKPMPGLEEWFVINWSKEDYVETGYTLSTTEEAIKVLQQSYLDGRLYFAGEHIPVSAKPGDAGFMNGAINSGKKAAEKWWESRR